MEEGYSVSGLSLSPRYFIVLDTQFKKDILQYIGFFEGKHVFRRTLFGKQIGLLSLYTKLDIGGEIKIGDEYRFKLVDVECDNAILNITYSRPFRVERFPLKERPKLRV